MYIKLDYFYLSVFDLDVKATEILNYIHFFSKEEYGPGQW